MAVRPSIRPQRAEQSRARTDLPLFGTDRAPGLPERGRRRHRDWSGSPSGSFRRRLGGRGLRQRPDLDKELSHVPIV